MAKSTTTTIKFKGPTPKDTSLCDLLYAASYQASGYVPKGYDVKILVTISKSRKKK